MTARRDPQPAFSTPEAVDAAAANPPPPHTPATPALEASQEGDHIHDPILLLPGVRLSALEVAVEAMRAQLLAEQLVGVRDAFLADCLGRAADEAVCLACTTPFPLLLLPVLLEEKCSAARSYCCHQAQVRRCSSRILRSSGLLALRPSPCQFSQVTRSRRTYG